MTFDCFDTVIMRAVGSPAGVGYVTGLQLARQVTELLDDAVAGHRRHARLSGRCRPSRR